MQCLRLLRRWTEPIILLLIIINGLVLAIQASRPHALPEDWPDDSPPPPMKGYFHAWEDYVLFVLFCLFTWVSGSYCRSYTG